MYVENWMWKSINNICFQNRYINNHIWNIKPSNSLTILCIANQVEISVNLCESLCVSLLKCSHINYINYLKVGDGKTMTERRVLTDITYAAPSAAAAAAEYSSLSSHTQTLRRQHLTLASRPAKGHLMYTDSQCLLSYPLGQNKGGGGGPAENSWIKADPISGWGQVSLPHLFVSRFKTWNN